MTYQFGLSLSFVKLCISISKYEYLFLLGMTMTNVFDFPTKENRHKNGEKEKSAYLIRFLIECLNQNTHLAKWKFFLIHILAIKNWLNIKTDVTQISYLRLHVTLFMLWNVQKTDSTGKWPTNLSFLYPFVKSYVSISKYEYLEEVLRKNIS